MCNAGGYRRSAIGGSRQPSSPKLTSIGQPIIEQILRDGLPVQAFTTTNASKAEVIEALALAFEQGTIAILNDPVLLGELQAFAAEQLPSGMLRYAAPQGGHDDTVISLALAWSVIRETPCYGLTEFLLRAQVDGSEEQRICLGMPAKPTVSDAANNACPACGSLVIQQASSGGKRCGMCGHQWQRRAAIDVRDYRGDVAITRSMLHGRR